MWSLLLPKQTVSHGEASEPSAKSYPPSTQQQHPHPRLPARPPLRVRGRPPPPPHRGRWLLPLHQPVLPFVASLSHELVAHTAAEAGRRVEGFRPPCPPRYLRHRQHRQPLRRPPKTARHCSPHKKVTAGGREEGQWAARPLPCSGHMGGPLRRDREWAAGGWLLSPRSWGEGRIEAEPPGGGVPPAPSS